MLISNLIGCLNYFAFGVLAPSRNFSVTMNRPHQRKKTGKNLWVSVSQIKIFSYQYWSHEKNRTHNHHLLSFKTKVKRKEAKHSGLYKALTCIDSWSYFILQLFTNSIRTYTSKGIKKWIDENQSKTKSVETFLDKNVFAFFEVPFKNWKEWSTVFKPNNDCNRTIQYSDKLFTRIL